MVSTPDQAGMSNLSMYWANIEDLDKVKWSSLKNFPPDVNSETFYI